MVIPTRARPSRARSTQRPVTVQVFPAFRRKVSVRLVRAAARAALAVGGTGAANHVSVALVDDVTVRSLNAQYRGLDEVTDVLAFAWEGPRPSPSALEVFPPVPGRVRDLGEVILSYPQAVRQAAEKGHSPAAEVALLVVHGVLHLQGYDHAEPEEEAGMRALESAALSRVEGLRTARSLLSGDGRGG